MLTFFLLSVCLLTGLLAALLFIPKPPKAYYATVAVGCVAVLVSACGVLFVKYATGRFDFVRPYAWCWLLLPTFILTARFLRRGLFVRRIGYSMAHLQVPQASLRVLATRWGALACYTLALVLCIAALARPVHVDRTVLPPSEGIDIILLMDVSGSMQKNDFYPNRFVAAQQTASRFIGKRPSDRIGLVAFAKSALLQAPLTLDHEALQEYIASMYLGMVNPDFTAIGDALGVAANHLKNSKAKSKIIILLTDGDSNAGAIDPVMAAKAAGTYGIRVYTIGTASAPDANPYSNAADEINEGLLLEIATTTGGKFYRAKNETELQQIYDTINELEKTEFSPAAIINRTDLYQPLLWLALGCMLLGICCEKLFFIKAP